MEGRSPFFDNVTTAAMTTVKFALFGLNVKYYTSLFVLRLYIFLIHQTESMIK